MEHRFQKDELLDQFSDYADEILNDSQSGPCIKRMPSKMDAFVFLASMVWF